MQPPPVNRPQRQGRVALVCDEPASGVYSRCLTDLGWTVIQARLFKTHSLNAPLPVPQPSDLRQAVAVLPSVRAVEALARQSWFEAAKPSLRAVVPGPQTALALRAQGVEPTWIATRGFRHSPFPPALLDAPKVYFGDASLRPQQLSLPRLGAADQLVPLYRQEPQRGSPWSARDARQIMGARPLLMLANSRRQLMTAQARLRMLGSKAPRPRWLVALSPAIAMYRHRGFWDATYAPALPNRDSMLELLAALEG